MDYLIKPHWHEGTPLLSDLTCDVPPGLQRACNLANEVAYRYLGYRNSCIVTSHALAAFLRIQRYEADLVRPEWHVFPEHGHGAALSWDGDGSRRPAASPGHWRGHLAVSCTGFLLDPTIDQLSTEDMKISPLVISMAGWWNEGTGIKFVDENGTFFRGDRYHRQAGWKSAPDARPSRWRPLLHRIADAWIR